MSHKTIFIYMVEDNIFIHFFLTRTLGIETHIMTPKEAKERCPLMNTDDLVVSYEL